MRDQIEGLSFIGYEAERPSFGFRLLFDRLKGYDFADEADEDFAFGCTKLYRLSRSRLCKAGLE